MEPQTPNPSGGENAPGQNKTFIIYVNTREKPWNDKKITFEEIVVLAFGGYSNDGNITYTVTFKKGEEKKSEGILVKGDFVPVKDKMVFNVTQTNRS